MTLQIESTLDSIRQDTEWKKRSFKKDYKKGISMNFSYPHSTLYSHINFIMLDNVKRREKRWL